MRSNHLRDKGSILFVTLIMLSLISIMVLHSEQTYVLVKRMTRNYYNFYCKNNSYSSMMHEPFRAS